MICSDCFASRKLIILRVDIQIALQETQEEKSKEKTNCAWWIYYDKPNYNITKGAVVNIRPSDNAKTRRMYHTWYKIVVSKLSFCRRIIVRAQLFSPFSFPLIFLLPPSCRRAPLAFHNKSLSNSSVCGTFARQREAARVICPPQPSPSLSLWALCRVRCHRHLCKWAVFCVCERVPECVLNSYSLSRVVFVLCVQNVDV